MKNRYFRAAFILCLVLSFPAWAEEFKTYVREDLGISLKYPAEWTFETDQEDDFFQIDYIAVSSSQDFDQPGEEGVGFGVIVFGEVDTETMSLDTLRDNVIADMKGFQEGTPKDFVTLAGMEWMHVSFEVDEDELVTVENELFAASHNDRLYLIMLVVHPPEVKKDYQPVIDRVLKSFLFL